MAIIVRTSQSRTWGQLRHDLVGPATADIRVTALAGLDRKFQIDFLRPDVEPAVRAKLASLGVVVENEVPDVIAAPAPGAVDVTPRPFLHVPLPATFALAEPVWHDGTSSDGRLSGEIRFELVNLTPLLVGCEGGTVAELPPQVRGEIQRRYQTITPEKPTLEPLLAPWGNRPVLLAADSLKGLLRHELGALLGAPMERVAERSYSYRPNLAVAQGQDAWLVPRLALVPAECEYFGKGKYRLPKRLLLFREGLIRNQHFSFSSLPNSQSYAYRGGMGLGIGLGAIRTHSEIWVGSGEQKTEVVVPDEANRGYCRTVDHLLSADGHFSERHPQDNRDQARNGLKTELEGGKAFQPGDVIWIEWDKDAGAITSIGWHFRYRWAYRDTVHQKDGAERRGLFPLKDEVGDIPTKLTPVRRLFGYAASSVAKSQTRGIGSGSHSQLMGRLFFNNAIEDVSAGDNDETRFRRFTVLRELGQPRPSAVEHYLQQTIVTRQDQATLATYGDLDSNGPTPRDHSGDLAGRKFYLDRAANAEDNSAENRSNKRSTLAINASQPRRTFRFTLRFRDLDPGELAACLLAFCPNQFATTETERAGGPGYCSKLGYARPLGWGSVQITAKRFFLLDRTNIALVPECIDNFMQKHGRHLPQLSMYSRWLAVHQRNHPLAGDYPRLNNEIFAYHTDKRRNHARSRRMR